LNNQFIAKHWYAGVYEQFENQTNDVDFLLNVLKEHTSGELNILEVCCGGGRICVPLAQAGYKVTGFDADEYMLMRCYKCMQGLPNLRIYQADATKSDWGDGFDVVVLAGNIMLNIESDMDNVTAERLFVQKAAKALKPGGHVFMDFDLHNNPESVFNEITQSSYFVGADELGTTGKTVSYGSVYDSVTRITTGSSHTELTLNNGIELIVPELWYKHIPSQQQINDWLNDSGFEVEQTWRDYTTEQLADYEPDGVRATIWARKKQR
jgi:2-polyprenyl-3-methyl-5-hydroxy-6-metoxy-1,4-benzoquinol methylase